MPFIYLAGQEIYISLFLDIWPQEAADKICQNSDSDTRVSNQEECQSLCLTNAACVGIAYSHKEGHTWCYRCYDDILSSANHEYSFYRRMKGTSFSMERRNLS